MKKINKIMMFPIQLLLMVLMGIFFGIRYLIKELKPFFKKRDILITRKAVNNNILTIICGSFVFIAETNFLLSKYLIESMPIKDRAKEATTALYNLEPLTNHSNIIIIFSITIIILAYLRIMKIMKARFEERQKLNNLIFR